MYTSDHGEALEAHSLTRKGPSVYEEIAHVPLLIRGGAYCPSPKRAVYSSVASHIDVVPTILDYFGMPILPSLSGTSMRAVIEHPDGPRLHEAVFVEFHRYEIDHDGFGGIQLMRAAISDRYKLAEFLLEATDEFFDRESDPYEVKNFIDDPAHKEARDHLQELLLAFMNDTRDPFRGYQWRCRPWNPVVKDWECDGCTRQRPSGPGELIQLDYDTGMEITETIRRKKKALKPAGSL